MKNTTNRQPQSGPTAKNFVAWFNKRYFVVQDGGQTWVVQESFDRAAGRRLLRRLSFNDFRNFYSNRRVRLGRGRSSLGDAWLRHPGRRQFDRLVFDPTGKAPSDSYNYWRGFGVRAQPGDWTRLRTHIKEVVCGGEAGLFRYVLGWMATAVQHPELRPEVALVFRGGQGTGKGIVARELGSLFGEYFFHASMPRHLTGTFNAHLETAVLVLADEAFGTSDKEAIANLKRLISEPTITIERKHHDVVTVPNYAHVIICTNHQWAVPADPDERRFCVADVRDTHKGDHKYFAAIARQQGDGGRSAMLWELLHHDLTGFNVRRAPLTDGLLEQKVHSLGAAEQWWLEKLETGELMPDCGWPRKIARLTLTKDFREAIALERDTTERGSATRLGSMLKRFIGLQPQSLRQHGDRYWIIPPLCECRDRFDKLLNHPYPWTPRNEGGNVGRRLPRKTVMNSALNPSLPTFPSLSRNLLPSQRTASAKAAVRVDKVGPNREVRQRKNAGPEGGWTKSHRPLRPARESR